MPERSREPSRAPIALGALTLLVVVVIAIIAWRLASLGSRMMSGTAPSAAPAQPLAPAPRGLATVAATRTAAAVASVDAPRTGHAGTRFFASWGGGLDQLGRDRPTEGNPMGPMSVAVDAQGRSYVLDEINGRIVRRTADGQPEAAIKLDVRLPEDIAIAKDGSIAVMDRLGDRMVQIYDPSGARRGKLRLSGEGIADTGTVTGIFVDGNDVYAERAHSELVKIGDTSGNEADPRTTLAGHPTRDGTALLIAAITDANAGRVKVTSTERVSNRVRFSREMQVWPVVRSILLLDSDSAGTIYFAVEAQRTEQSPTVVLSCLDPFSGVVVGGAILPANVLPEESMRDFAVLDGGGVIYALRSDEGVTYQRYDCH